MRCVEHRLALLAGPVRGVYLFVCVQRAELEMSSEELQAQRRRESLMGRVRERRCIE